MEEPLGKDAEDNDCKDVVGVGNRLGNVGIGVIVGFVSIFDVTDVILLLPEELHNALKLLDASEPDIKDADPASIIAIAGR